ncbi:hypothetical protein BJF79_44000 [Actinomadura sp. CNU-125]|nr:hypothetical protein BJF79_44000 [Actinomadura sp. CNU-125]
MTATGWAVRDGWIVMDRHLRHVRRVPQILFFSTVQPVVFLFLLAAVFGRAVQVPGIEYAVFLVPGVFVQSMSFSGASTSVGLAEDMRGGFIDRYRSLPMSRSAVLVGRIAADAVRNLLVVIGLAAVAHLIGFRFETGPLEVLAGLAMLLLFGLSLSCVGACIGLAARTPEAAHMASTIWIFPLVYTSTAFVPMELLPEWLRVWAGYSPVTAVVGAMRGLFFGYGDTTGSLILTLSWSALIGLVCVPLAVRLFNRAASR